MKPTCPRVLIEEWLPASAIGVECMRERGSSSALAPTTFLHVWWARRPLTLSRAAVLASLLPADFPKEAFERLIGLGKPAHEVVAIRALMDAGVRVEGGFGYERAYKNTIPADLWEQAWDAIREVWGEQVAVSDPMAGGGSIPLEATRLGIDTYANEYNPVASVILKTTVELTARYGLSLAQSARQWAQRWLERAAQQLNSFYPAYNFARVHAYLYARTVPCPDTGHPTPLVPDWHVVKGGSVPIVAEPIVDAQRGTWSVRFREVGRGAGQLAQPPSPTYVRGKGVSLFTGKQIPDDYIKAMAQGGKLGSQLYAIVLKTNRLEFRPPSPDDLNALQRAEQELQQRLPQWLRDNIVPSESVPEGDKTRELHSRGVRRWIDMFAPRQLLALGVLVETLRTLEPEILQTEGEERGVAVLTLLAMIVDKFADYNCMTSIWHSGRQVIAHAFAQHAFPFKPTFAELAACGSGGGLEWAINNVLEAYEDLCRLPRAPRTPQVRITQGDAAQLHTLDDGSLTAIVVDPPYADNVQYSELANFFYVWLKRTVGRHYPEWFSTPLCEDAQEAVMNPARFRKGASAAKTAREQALRFYHQRMRESFAEYRRVLRDDGVLTVMFTHKAQEAWESLFESLIESGFQITATWPVKTESEHSLHQARKNAAQSTVLLTARKRAAGAGVGFWDWAMQDEIRRRVRETAERLEREGLNKVDQLVGTFGAAMAVFSRYDAVRTDTGELVSVRDALELASDAVMEWQIEQIAARGLERVDAESRFILLCWDVLGAAEFRFNEAKLIGHAVGMTVEQLVAAGWLEKRQENLRITPAQARRRKERLTPDEAAALHTLNLFGEAGRGRRRGVSMANLSKVHPDDPSFRTVLDACYALALAYLEAGGGAAGEGAAKTLQRRHHWGPDSAVAALMHALTLVAPPALRHEPKSTAELAAHYPEFRAWHALLKPLFGIEPPDWSAPAPAQPSLLELDGEDAEEA